MYAGEGCAENSLPAMKFEWKSIQEMGQME